MLHAYRHKRAVRRLLRPGPLRRILVVCHGNVCRSPYLEAVLQRRLPQMVVTSGGFIAPGRPAPDVAVETAARRGIDLAIHRSRKLSRAMLTEADLVIVMEPEQAKMTAATLGSSAKVIVAGDLDPIAGQPRAVQDPFRQPPEVFEATYARLDRCGATIAKTLNEARRTRS